MNVPKSQSALQSTEEIFYCANLSSKNFIPYAAEHKKRATSGAMRLNDK